MEANMRYPLTHDPEANRYHRARALGGAVILFTVAAGFITLAWVAPPAPEQFAVNCHDVQLGTGLSDAPPDLTGCVPARPARQERVRSMPQPASPLPTITAKQFEDMHADDPPIATF
jgi:hypothetical protein